VKLELRDRMLVSVVAYSGPRSEEVVCRLAWRDIGDQAVRSVDTKRHKSACFRPNSNRRDPSKRTLAIKRKASVPGDLSRRLLSRDSESELRPAGGSSSQDPSG
jgi:hypothetical protein